MPKIAARSSSPEEKNAGIREKKTFWVLTSSFLSPRRRMRLLGDRNTQFPNLFLVFSGCIYRKGGRKRGVSQKILRRKKSKTPKYSHEKCRDAIIYFFGRLIGGSLGCCLETVWGFKKIRQLSCHYFSSSSPKYREANIGNAYFLTVQIPTLFERRFF